MAKAMQPGEHTEIEPPLDLTPESRGQAPAHNRLAGQFVLVVGGGQTELEDIEDRSMVRDTSYTPPIGNGRAISILLAREGATVVVADLSRKGAEATVAAIDREGKTKAMVVVGDVTQTSDCQRIVHETLELTNGRLDGLVLSVGIVGSGSAEARNSIDHWDRVFAVNLRAHFIIIREAVSHMYKSPRGGSIVSIGSISQLQPVSNEPAYHASKAGVSALIKNIAYQYAPRVRANCVVPGLIDTPMGRRAGKFLKGRDASAVPLARQGTGWDIAYAVLWLLSGESSFVTAQNIIVDGGTTGIQKRARRRGEGDAM
jgi:NAD(P)-dependent dehydrogenase (short-subunit alcohol dehydrogenase family)